MRSPPNASLDSYRLLHTTLGGLRANYSPPGADYGCFVLGPLRIISNGSGDEWEHVSVSCNDRCPTWDEMSMVKRLFWSKDETVLQFHPRSDKYKNNHPYCLHLWKRRGEDHELPPDELI
jgi:hypothetical protein